MKKVLCALLMACAALAFGGLEPMAVTPTNANFSGKASNETLLTGNALLFAKAPHGSTATLDLKEFPVSRGSISFWVSPRTWDGQDGKAHVFAILRFKSSPESPRKSLMIYRYENKNPSSAGLGICTLLSWGNGQTAVLNLPNNKIGTSWSRESWHHIVYNFDEAGMELHIDGEFVAKTAKKTEFTPECTLILGPSWGDFSDTAMDRFAISSAPMTREEIDAEYEAGMTKAGILK